MLLYTRLFTPYFRTPKSPSMYNTKLDQGGDEVDCFQRSTPQVETGLGQKHQQGDIYQNSYLQVTWFCNSHLALRHLHYKSSAAMPISYLFTLV